MRAAALCLALALALAACDALPGKPTEAERPLRPEQVLDFATLYGDNCSGCHGADGTLAAARPLNDPVYLALAGSDRLRQIIAGGVAGSLMPGFAISAGGTLTDRQVDLLATDLVSHWGGTPPVGVALPPYTAGGAGNAQRGQAAYATHCAGCHGADGSGSAKGGSVIDGSYLALVSDQALRSAVICGRPDLGMPDWRGDGSRPMSDQEITDVVAWLIAQRPKFPGQPYAIAAQ